MNSINRAAVLAFFSGKAQVNAAAALDLLDASIAQGFWVKGASRKVVAALNKANVAEKLARKVEKEEGRLSTYDPDEKVAAEKKALWNAVHVLQYGVFSWLPKMATPVVSADSPYAGLVAMFSAYRSALLPVALAVVDLDATRPKPVFTTLGASPTVTRTVESFDAVKVEVCPMEFKKVTVTDPKTGKDEIRHVVRLLWPKGTVHGVSRWSRFRDCQCEACGHAIRNPFNWIPLILTAKDGTPKALWVGRDCAKTLFGIDMVGDLEITELA